MIYYFIIKLNSLLFKVNSGFGTMKCISHFHRCNEYTPVMFRNSYCKESIFLSQKEARSERWLPFRGFFLVTRSHDFFFNIWKKKKPDELIVVNQSVGTSSTFKVFLNVHTLLYFSFDDCFCANKAPPTMFLKIMQPKCCSTQD